MIVLPEKSNTYPQPPGRVYTRLWYFTSTLLCIPAYPFQPIARLELDAPFFFSFFKKSAVVKVLIYSLGFIFEDILFICIVFVKNGGINIAIFVWMFTTSLDSSRPFGPQISVVGEKLAHWQFSV